MERDTFLTISSLQNYLSLEVPRTLRRTLTGNRRQTPKVWGNMSRAAILANFTKIFAGREQASKSLLADMKRASLFGYDLGSIRSLSGFNKRFHQVPDSITDSTRGFVQKVGSIEVSSLSETLFSALRSSFKYKRRVIDLDEDEGSASIMTPDFTVNLTIEIDNDNPSGYVLATEVTDIRNNAAVNSDEFSSVFSKCFDRVIFELSDPMNLEDIIDRIEEFDDEDFIRVNYPTDISFCDVTIDGLDGVLHIEPYKLSFVRTRKEQVGDLLAACRELPTLLINHGIAGFLPTSKE